MLTDIFAARYADVELWDRFRERESKLLVQSYRLLAEEICPYYTVEGYTSTAGVEFWTEVHDRLSMELGLFSLDGQRTQSAARVEPFAATQRWLQSKFGDRDDADRFMKERLSLVEIAFRIKGDAINADLASLTPEAMAVQKRVREQRGMRAPSVSPTIRAVAVNEKSQKYAATVAELNERLRQAGCKLHYHNGLIQCSDDSLTTETLVNPFWKVVATTRWANVDTDMKQACDLRDTGGRNPAKFAADALESAIKIVSGEKGWTRGTENGVSNYIDNLVSGKFLAAWEAVLLKTFFTNVRNPLGHGPGAQPMPALSADQTNWAIETAMSWIKMLVRRSGL